MSANLTTARMMTEDALDWLHEPGAPPIFTMWKSRPTDRTPTYDETCYHEQYVPNAGRGRTIHYATEHGNPGRVISAEGITEVIPARPRRVEHAQPVHLARIAIPQRPLSYAVSRRTDPATSREAAQSVVDPSKGTYQRILTLLRQTGGATDERLMDVWAGTYASHPISPSGLRSRRNELTRRGLIVDSGERAKTRAGRRSIVWRLP